MMPDHANLYLRRALEFEKTASLTFDFGQKNAYLALANGYRKLAALRMSAHLPASPPVQPRYPNE
jgi:hypothetical protein